MRANTAKLTSDDHAEIEQRLVVIQRIQQLTRATAHMKNDPFFERFARAAACARPTLSSELSDSTNAKPGLVPANEMWKLIPEDHYMVFDLDEYALSRTSGHFETPVHCDFCDTSFSVNERESPRVLWLGAGTVVVEFHFCYKCGQEIGNRFNLTAEAWRDDHGAM